MKRLILLPLTLWATMLSWAVTVPSDFRVMCRDGSVSYFRGVGTELTFNEDGTIDNSDFKILATTDMHLDEDYDLNDKTFDRIFKQILNRLFFL